MEQQMPLHGGMVLKKICKICSLSWEVAYV